MKIDLARFYLKTAGFALVALNAPCNKGTLPSQSVAASLSIPGRPPNVNVGAQPLLPGTLLPKGAGVGITWSGCYPAGTTVPFVTGQTFAGAVHLLHLAALNWACYSVGESPTTTTRPPRTTTTRPPRTTTTRPPRTTTTRPDTTSTADPTSSTATTTTTLPLPPTTTTATLPERVIAQGTKGGTATQAGAVVALVMHRCPQ
jgi:hypothetical protein